MTAARGKRLLLVGLSTLFVLNLVLSLMDQTGTPVTTFGRPLAVGLLCLLAWQGRRWAAILVIVLSLGVLFAGPLFLLNGVRATSVAGALSWLCSVLAGMCVWFIVMDKSVQAYLATRRATTK